ncbi:guanine nucleotide exchange factor MSS4 homolog isoform X1 [Leptidea sinapis]|uniref:guanine nucleotide exchange factor MSS4 homolog isoform X1 n=1 Tax=Leptidea sinapis TaxID=189913 RepID=UPI00213AEA4A|nr:guanine nucleotide exchange factor MSS4 homolog isoform X1 [Leptidea sinapis]
MSADVEVNSIGKELIENGTNKLEVKCKFCGSKMLDKNSGKYITQQKDLPLMLQDKSNSGEIQTEAIYEFYYVESMFTFYKMGFTNTVDNFKYLSCADCDAGPVGYYDMNTKHSFLALSRVNHV